VNWSTCTQGIRIDRFLWEADFALDTSRRSAARGDVVYVSGCLFRCIACLVQALYERYFVNEKESMAAVAAFAQRPPGFAEVVSKVLAEPGDHPARLQASIQRPVEIVAAVRGVRWDDR